MASFVPPRADSTTAQKWFEESTTVDGDFRALLENYSHVPSADVVQHVVDTRNRAWEVHPYPCLGQFRFLELNLSKRGLYKSLVQELTANSSASSGRFLDVGCCLGQDLRKLISDGVPPERVAGAELNGAFIDLGYDLFRDKERLQGKTPIVSANILEDPSEPSSPLSPLIHTFSSVQLGMLLHLFTWEEQLIAFKHTLTLLRGQPGDRIFGQATGNLDGTPTASVGQRATFKHNVETFTRLIAEFSASTSTSWRVVTAELDNGLSVFDGKRIWDDPRTRRLVFEISWFSFGLSEGNPPLFPSPPARSLGLCRLARPRAPPEEPATEEPQQSTQTECRLLYYPLLPRPGCDYFRHLASATENKHSFIVNNDDLGNAVVVAVVIIVGDILIVFRDIFVFVFVFWDVSVFAVIRDVRDACILAVLPRVVLLLDTPDCVVPILHRLQHERFGADQLQRVNHLHFVLQHHRHQQHHLLGPLVVAAALASELLVRPSDARPESAMAEDVVGVNNLFKFVFIRVILVLGVVAVVVDVLHLHRRRNHIVAAQFYIHDPAQAPLKEHSQHDDHNRKRAVSDKFHFVM